MEIPFWVYLPAGICITVSAMWSWFRLYALLSDPHVKSVKIQPWFLIKNTIFLFYWSWILFS